MAKSQVQFSKQDSWRTPQEVFDFLPQIDYDPCTTAQWAQQIGVPNYDTIQTDGLKRDWTQFHTIYVNPPFTRKFEFLEKAVGTVKQWKGKKDRRIYFLFPIDSLTTKKFHEAMGDTKYLLILPNGRIKFNDGSGRKSSPAFGSVLLLLTGGCSSRRVTHWRMDA